MDTKAAILAIQISTQEYSEWVHREEGGMRYC